MRLLIGLILAVTWPGMWVMGGQCPQGDAGVPVLCVGTGGSCVELLGLKTCERRAGDCGSKCPGQSEQPEDTPADPREALCTMLCGEGRPRQASSIETPATSGVAPRIVDLFSPPPLMVFEAYALHEIHQGSRERSHRECAGSERSSLRAQLGVWLN